MFLAHLLLAAAVADFNPTPADHVLNPDFDSDPAAPETYEGSSGPEPSHWRWYLSYGGAVTWDTARGDPAPGSAHVDNWRSGAHYDALAQCITLGPGAYSVQARVAALVKPGAACEMRVQVVDQPECNTVALVLVDQRVRNSTNTGAFEQLGLSGVAPAGTGAMAIWLAHVSDATAQTDYSDCWYDHVEFTGEAVFAAAFE